MSKSLTLSCGGTVDISNHSKRNMQYRAPIHKIQHVFADTVYGVIDGSGLIGELIADPSRDYHIHVVSIDKKIGDYNKEIKLGDRFILTKQTNVRFNGVFESVLIPSPFWVIDGVQYYITVLEKMQIGGHHVKQFFTANSELTNAELSEDGITLRHNIVEPKQGDNTFGASRRTATPKGAEDVHGSSTSSARESTTTTAAACGWRRSLVMTRTMSAPRK